MPIEFRKGDLFTSGADALVNTVNCEGVMGGGIALSFKKKYPEYYNDYKNICDQKREEIGFVRLYPEVGLVEGIINFPTKDKVQDPSLIGYIELGLNSLRYMLSYWNIRSVAIPALGCGLGGLDWRDVKPLIEKELWDLDTSIMVYEPL
jgi:O-acetyl-ADP-ribose deacetylase (regulator of RNase III)